MTRLSPLTPWHQRGISVLSHPDPTPSTWKLWGQDVTGQKCNQKSGGQGGQQKRLEEKKERKKKGKQQVVSDTKA